MADHAFELRQGQPWSEEEEAQLIAGICNGLTLQDLAVRHGRAAGAVRGRLDRFLAYLGPAGIEAPEWLKAQPTSPGESDAPSPDRETRGDGPSKVAVLAEWQHVSGHALSPQRRVVFLARRVTDALVAVPAMVRRASAQRLWHEQGQLLLDDWLLECLCPGAVALTGDWAPVADRDADTMLVLRELAAVAVAEDPDDRSRRIMESRLGLHDRPAQTLAAVGQTLGLTGERVRQLQEKALRRMWTDTAPASRKFRTTLAELSCIDGVPPAAKPAPPERLLVLAQAIVPSAAPRQAVLFLARLAGAPRKRAESLATEAAHVLTLRHAAARRETALQDRIERATRRWRELAALALWPASHGAPPRREELEALRKTDPAHSGMWFCPKLGRDVAYESDTELSVIQLLSFSTQIAYYQEQPLSVGYRYDGQQRTYYPDLLAVTTDGRCIVIEVKPQFEMATAINVVKYRALQQFCDNRGWGFVMTDNGNRTRTLLETRPVDPRLDASLSAALAHHGQLTWPQVRAAIGTTPLHWADMSALILKNGWDLHTSPYRLRLAASPRSGDIPSIAQTSIQETLTDEPGSSGVKDSAVNPTPSPDDIAAARTPAGGWRRDQLAAWGVPWPAPKGWKRQLIARWEAQQRQKPTRWT